MSDSFLRLDMWRPWRRLSDLKCKMAGAWEGFTEEDIGFYKKNNEELIEKNVPKKKPANLQGPARKNLTRDRIPNEQTPDPEKKLPETAKLLQNPSHPAPHNEQKQDNEAEAGPTITGTNPVCLKVIEGKAYELVDRNTADASKATLEIFEARQKMLEEQNKKRKEMLAKVISARKKQTTEEAKRLQHIQEELQKLDMLLSNDVGILRNKIEEASLDFVEAQKRYNKAEKEFLDAKQNLFVKLEKKELLTKLLCTIIEQNELRKAQKLSELMEKLNINETTNSVIYVPQSQSALKEPPEKQEDKVKKPS